jgi:hypothetical protein
VIIFWGWTTITRTVGEGAFYCPRCRVHTSYSHQRIKEYFTLYFIPLFPTNTIGEFIECRECGTTFQPSIRDLSPEQIEERQRPWKCSDCQGLNPPSEMHCLNCKARRPRKDVAGQAAPARGGQDHGTFPETPPSQAQNRHRPKRKAVYQIWRP